MTAFAEEETNNARLLATETRCLELKWYHWPMHSTSTCNVCLQGDNSMHDLLGDRFKAVKTSTIAGH